MRITQTTWIAVLLALSALSRAPVSAEDSSLHNTEIYVSPWAGEAPGKGTFSVRHEGQGEPPKEGYFKKHEPGEVAEFHLFVPDGLDPDRKYPLLVVFHGGKDGGSGKGMCGRFAKASTVEHPVIVLSPNMYTMDAMNELIAEGELPIDTRRVVVFGHSSGGMGVRAAMAEYVRTKGEFVPAALISSSTTASLGRADYPPCPYYVLAGEKETPAFVTNEILKDRRRTCRVHALTMQQVFREVRYIEIQGSGHSGGTPAHQAIIQHAIAVSAREAGELQEIAAIAALKPESSYVDRDRAFHRYDRARTLAETLADTPEGKKLAAALATLGAAKHWSAELAAREAYLVIVAERPGPAMKEKLEQLRQTAPETEYGRNRTREKLLALQDVQAQAAPEELPDGPPITNPYYPKSGWRVWRDDPSPVENVQTLVRVGKEKNVATITLAPTPEAQRIYPAGPLREGEPVKWEAPKAPSERFAGVWDDVYASWSGLHGYVRSSWRTTDGSAVHLRPKGLDHIMHFVEIKKTSDLLRCGINFVHQSTTGMAHTITNAYSQEMTASYERIYFSDCLVTAPAHASFTEEWSDRTKDMYLALVPTLFNSVGSSNSETMAITKMMVVGGYLPPESKVLLKRNGLYPAALLYMWKASLPYDVPYDHELRHRIAYRALGRDDQFPGKYGHAGGERGNLAIEFHRYDEIAHMRNMIRMAQAMTVLPPEAVLDEIDVSGGKGVYGLKKAALVLQEPGQDVTVRLSAAKSYDLADRPLSYRLRLLYGNRDTICEPGDEPGTFVIRVPWDDSLPEGRTAVALIANNGVHDSNPAIVSIFRKRIDLPPPGAGPGGYNYNSPHANRRPVILGLQDRVVTPGETVRIDLNAIDPEGQPVRFYNRAGEPGELDGNRFTMKVPKDAAGGGGFDVTFIASDATAGNSYAAKRVNFATAPPVHAHIECEAQIGPAPFTVKVSAEGSRAASGKIDLGWEFYLPKPKHAPAAWEKQAHGKTATHTFDKPGLYEVALTVNSGKTTDRETLSIWVTKGAAPAPPGGIEVEGNGARIRDGDDTPGAFDHTHFGALGKGERRARTFLIVNRGEEEISCSSRAVAVTGAHAGDFRVLRAPRKKISPGGSATFAVEFRPRAGGARTAEVTVRTGPKTVKFAIAGESRIPIGKDDTAPKVRRTGTTEAGASDSAKRERKAKSLWNMAENFRLNGRADLAEKNLKKIIAEYPDTSYAEKARAALGR